MDVLLLNPPVGIKSVHKCTPLGLAYIASSLEKNGFETGILDAKALDLNFKDIVEVINKKEPKIVGITSTSLQIRTVMELARMIKSETNALLIIGGVHSTISPYSIKKYGIFDYIFTGEGEISFPLIVKSILKGNIKKGAIIKGKMPRNLDEIPLPSHHLLPLKKYFLPVTSKRPSYVETSRGCHFNCSFCSIRKRKLRFKSASRTLEELEYLKDLGVGYVNFSDEIFTFNKKHVYNLCNEIFKNKLDLEWGCQTRCDFLDKSMALKMHRAGCKLISFGVESGSPRIRKLLGKPFTNHEIFKVFKICSDIGIDTGALFILGIPSETRKEMLQTLEFAKKLNPDYCGFSLLSLYPDTGVFLKALEEGKISKDVWDEFIDGGDPPLYIPDMFTRREFKVFRNIVYRKFYFRWKYFLKKARSIKSYKDLIRYLYYGYLILSS
jgi:radical SAM superfamily enzyme YgiQ (UPF0313 family)